MIVAMERASDHARTDSPRPLVLQVVLVAVRRRSLSSTVAVVVLVVVVSTRRTTVSYSWPLCVRNSKKINQASRSEAARWSQWCSSIVEQYHKGTIAGKSHSSRCVELAAEFSTIYCTTRYCPSTGNMAKQGFHSGISRIFRHKKR